MRRTSRLFEIIQLLRSARKPLTAAALAETLEVTKRTVYRDVASLQAMSVPIYGEAGVGYVMRPGYDLPPLMLSVEEVEALERLPLILSSACGRDRSRFCAQPDQPQTLGPSAGPVRPTPLATAWG
jgi:predicted DNA-binding transcriptional regulator YafY